jgi:hypothetical protein
MSRASPTRYVEAKSNRPGDAPAINPLYLSEEPDRRTIIGGFRSVRQIFAGPASTRLVQDPLGSLRGENGRGLRP